MFQTMPNRILIKRGSLLMPIYITETVLPLCKCFGCNMVQRLFIFKPTFIQIEFLKSSATQDSDFSKYLANIKKMNYFREMRGLPNQKKSNIEE